MISWVGWGGVGAGGRGETAARSVGHNSDQVCVLCARLVHRLLSPSVAFLVFFTLLSASFLYFIFFSPPPPPSPLHRLVGLASSPLVFVVRLLGYPVGHDAVAKAALPTPHLPLPTTTTLRAFFPGSQGQPSQMSPADTQLSKDCIPGSKHSRQTMQLFLLTLENVKCFFSPPPLLLSLQCCFLPPLPLSLGFHCFIFKIKL